MSNLIERATDHADNSPLRRVDVRAVLEGIYEDARNALTAPVHHALIGAASRLEELLGIEAGTPPFNRGPAPTVPTKPGGGGTDEALLGLVSETLAGGKGLSVPTPGSPITAGGTK